MDSLVNRTRFALSSLILLSILYLFYRDIFGYSPKEKCHRFMPISCRNYFFIIFTLLVILELGHLGRVGTGISYVVEKLPWFWYLALMGIIPYVMRMVFLSREPIPISDDFRAFPNTIIKRKTRPVVVVLILVLIFVSIALEAFSVFLEIGNTMNSPMDIVSGMFSHPNQLISALSKTRLLEIPILIYLHNIYKNYSACSYDLPKNWNN